MSSPTIPELYNACTVLFGPDVDASVDFLKYLQPSGVKAAYRQKAKETHPDRSVVIGKSEELLNQLFKEVNQAYEQLNLVVGDDSFFSTVPLAKKSRKKEPRSWWRNSSGSKAKKPKRSRTRPEETNHSERVYVPERELSFGQFLYHSGHISWNVLVESIVWQRMSRPILGKLATEWNLISEDQVCEILKARVGGEKFGDCAIRMGFLNEFNVKVLLWKQRKIEKPIGDYFIINNILSADAVEILQHRSKRHNLEVVYRAHRKNNIYV